MLKTPFDKRFVISDFNYSTKQREYQELLRFLFRMILPCSLPAVHDMIFTRETYEYSMDRGRCYGFFNGTERSAGGT